MGLKKAAIKQWTNWKREKKNNLKIKWFQVIVIRLNIIIKFNVYIKLLLLDLIVLLKVRHNQIKNLIFIFFK